MVADFDWRGAEAEGRRALALAPRDPYMQFSFAYVLASTGRVQEALALTRRALRDEPLRASWYNLLATYLVEKDSGVGAYQIAEVYALRGDANATFQWLDRAWATAIQGSIIFSSTPSSCASRTIHASPRSAARWDCRCRERNPGTHRRDRVSQRAPLLSSARQLQESRRGASSR